MPQAPKRRKSSTKAVIDPAEVDKVRAKVMKLYADDLQKLACAGLESPRVFSLAKELLASRKANVRHCIRCHQKYDPRYADEEACVMEEHDPNGGLNRVRGLDGCDAFAYGCCERMEDDYEPCFKGPHIDNSKYGGGYWADNQENEDCSKCQSQKAEGEKAKEGN
jgi:hypothetical protein